MSRAIFCAVFKLQCMRWTAWRRRLFNDVFTSKLTQNTSGKMKKCSINSWKGPELMNIQKWTAGWGDLIISTLFWPHPRHMFHCAELILYNGYRISSAVPLRHGHGSSLGSLEFGVWSFGFSGFGFRSALLVCWNPLISCRQRQKQSYGPFVLWTHISSFLVHTARHSKRGYKGLGVVTGLHLTGGTQWSSQGN